MNRFAIIIATSLAIVFFAVACDESGDHEESEESSATVAEVEVTTASLVLDIDGMTCVNCAADIEDRLASVDGVVEGSINFGDRQAHIEYDADTVEVDQIIAAIVGEDEQYTATPAVSDDSDDS